MLLWSHAMDGLSRFCCLNSDCPDYGKRGAGNLSVTSRYGPAKARRMLRCRTCKARFSERKGTVFFGAHLSPERVDTVMEHIHEGCGVRRTGRLCRVSRHTVGRYSRLGGEHSRDLHDELVALSPPNARGSVRREVGLRGQEGEELRPRRPGR
jgi:transposase-like protein